MSDFPKKSSYQVEYWDCGLGPIKGHKHKTKQIAIQCIEFRRREKKPQSMHGQKRQKEKAAYGMQRAGMTIAEIASHFDVSKQTISAWIIRYRRQIARAVERRKIPLASRRSLAKRKDSLEGLPARAANALKGEGLFSRKDVLEFHGQKGLTEIPNIGGKTIQDILDWADSHED
jgi:transposase-like protein